MAGLSNSRWATPSRRSEHSNYTSLIHDSTSTTNDTSNLNHKFPDSTAPAKWTKIQKELVNRNASIQKFNKLTRRLKWKSRALSYSYYRVLNEKQYNVVNDQLFPMGTHEAETMFKIDFFEYYVLLERVLVHLLGVFGMVITAAHASDVKPDADGRRSDKYQQPTIHDPTLLRTKLIEQSRLGDSRAFHGYEHRFHANVLAAIDRKDNPLHDVLGKNPVRDYLGIAKEFRNRWKDADEKGVNGHDDELVGSRYEQALKELNLEIMLGGILQALDLATPIATWAFDEFKSTVDTNSDVDNAMAGLEKHIGDAPTGAMDDLMDWD